MTQAIESSEANSPNTFGSHSMTRPAGESDHSRTAVLEAIGLTKSFGATRAVTDGTLAVFPGEIVALLGENGSGKSTMVKLLSGVYGPDAGSIKANGQDARFDSPRASLSAGIVTIFQEILVGRDRSVLDNLWLGNGPARLGKRLIAERRRTASDVWTSLAGETVDLDMPAGQLSLMQQQVCVIARALLRQPRLLILDESTSTLDVILRDRLFAELTRRCRAGMGALFISHRMDEVLTVADRYVALRSGAVVGQRNRGEATAHDLVSLISGSDARSHGQRSARQVASDRLVVNSDDLVIREGREGFPLRVRKGEILGLAGLEGHGQDELIRTLAGLRRAVSGDVSITTKGQKNAATNYRTGVRRGVVYVPRDRKVEGMADVLSILDNYGLPTLKHDSRLGVFRRRSTKNRFTRDAATVNFVHGCQDNIGRLSGGNQQKVIVARWLAARPELILLNDPTRGVDQKTKHELYDVFRELADAGTTIVMVSSEVDELVHLMDRVLVFHDGSLSAELVGAHVTPDAIVSAYFAGKSPKGVDEK